MSVVTIGIDAAASVGQAITTGAANTKGSYAQLTASLSAACVGLLASFRGDTILIDLLFDLATGAAASETVVLADLAHSVGRVRHITLVGVPLAIAQSTRVAARGQATGATELGYIAAYTWALDSSIPMHGATTADTYGANTTDSGGVSVDPGGTINTKGAYAELTSSCNAVQSLSVLFANQVNTVRTSCDWIIDIATGAAGVEAVKLADIWTACSLNSDSVIPDGYPSLPVAITASTRIAARAACNINDATDRLIDVIVVGTRGASASSSGGVNRALLPSGVSALG